MRKYIIPVLLFAAMNLPGQLSAQSGPKCCVTTFEAPTDRSGQEDGTNPDGTVYLYEHFEAEAEFDNTEPCQCSCCEYRQSLKGECSMDGNDITIDLVDPDDNTKTIEMSDTDFNEDYRNYSGTFVRYGHRSETRSAAELYSNDGTNADRANGCKYHLTDEPGWKNARAGHRYKMEFTFRGEIVNTCEAECDGCEQKEWTVSLDKSF